MLLDTMIEASVEGRWNGIIRAGSPEILMKTPGGKFDADKWRPQSRFRASIGTKEQLRHFNEFGGVGVFVDIMRDSEPDIEIIGSLSASVCFWETRSRSGFVTKPKFSAELLTLRFVTNGNITYLRRDGEVTASTSIAALTGFDELREVRASSAVNAVSATIASASLSSAHDALTGESQTNLPALEPIAEMTRPGMAALLCTIRLVQRRLQDLDQHSDLLLPLVQEILSYQLLSAWPERPETIVRSYLEPTPPANRVGDRLYRSQSLGCFDAGGCRCRCRDRGPVASREIQKGARSYARPIYH